ncbi:hypothetical protein [Rhizobium sp. S163]|uniref:hypothetical protein n=1 Tax=Rhizobium sp. S163 TaxID=3055039 RepID=UPI0025A9662C|nr:hypothetical protein [Rhizobium sp. S163]MDM9646756.1 hypothetical protein [Rhizobium sp. S163]
MENEIFELNATTEIEILPPERECPSAEGTTTCLCCGRRSFLEEDGCGICEECLAP